MIVDKIEIYPTDTPLDVVKKLAESAEESKSDILPNFTIESPYFNRFQLKEIAEHLLAVVGTASDIEQYERDKAVYQAKMMCSRTEE